MDWTHGYYANQGYSYGYYPETMPARLRWASLLHGHLVPERGFRYLDAGCGQGLNLLIAAALHPDSEFVGIDFLPEHVANARDLARHCGLDNVTIIEGDFVELAADPSALGPFDMAVCHGISTWVGEPVKQALFKLIGATLRPGGIFYNSYNTQPGWLGAVPFQHLILLEQRSRSGPEALKAARGSLDRLSQCADAMFKAQPSLGARLKSTETQDPAYLLQEYNNEFWRPVFVSEMIDAMRAVKLDFLGTATLADAFENLMKPELRDLLKEQPSVVLREQMRDYAISQSFRRDIYVKGKRQSWELEHADAVRSYGVLANPLIPRPQGDQPYKIMASGTELAGNAKHYNALLAQIEASPGGLTVAELIDAETDRRRKSSVFETLSMMVHGGWLTPRLPAPNPLGPEIVAALAQAVCQGAPYRYTPLPATGTAQRLNDTDWIMLQLVGEGVARAQMAPKLIDRLGRLNRKLARDGKPIDDAQQSREHADKLVGDFFERILPYLRSVGVVRAA
jgi:SAM-dependent methyltransferase